LGYIDSDPDLSSSSSERKIDYPTALTNTMLAQTTDDNETSSSTSLKEGFEMARLAASTNTQSSFFDSNILSYSLATRAHL